MAPVDNDQAPVGRIGAGHEAPGRCWFLSDVFHEDQSTGFFFSRIAERAARVFEVHAITTRAPRRHLPSPAGIRLHAVGPPRYGERNIVFRALTGAAFIIAAGIRLRREIRRGDVVIAVTNPPFLPYMAGWVAARRGARFVLYVHDLYPDVLVAAGMLRRGSSLYRWLERRAGRLFSGCQAIVVLGRDMKERVEEYMATATGRRRPTLRVLPTWADTNVFRPSAAERFAVRQEWQVGDSFVVFFFGNMGRTHDLESLLECARSLREQRDIEFVVSGRGHGQRAVMRAIGSGEGGNVRFLAPPEAGRLRGYLNAADIVVIPMKPGMGGVSVPSRLYSIMATGRPVLAATERNAELARVILGTGAGAVVPAGLPPILAHELVRLRDDPEARRAMGAAARGAAVRSYAEDAVLQAWTDFLRLLRGSPWVKDRTPS
jgi:colanic acid biosynthesis glycosyl transferase WcaI